MSRPDTVVDEGRFRAVAHSTLAIAGTFGTTDGDGVGDLLCVQVNGDGLLIPGDADNCDGVIWTPESRRSNHRVTEVEQKTALAGKTYTVFERAILVEMEAGSDPLSAGDRVYSAAAGGISTSDATGVYLGVVIPNPVTAPNGLKLILRVTPFVEPGAS
jgi:hypothetical protein